MDNELIGAICLTTESPYNHDYLMGSMCTRKGNVKEPVKAMQHRESIQGVDPDKISQETSFNTSFIVAPKTAGKDFKEDDFARLERRAQDRRPSVEKNDPILLQTAGAVRNTKQPSLDEEEPAPPKIRHSIQTNRVGAAQLSLDGLEEFKAAEQTPVEEKAVDINALLAELEDTN
jgi:hypothetical protein